MTNPTLAKTTKLTNPGLLWVSDFVLLQIAPVTLNVNNPLRASDALLL
jgi:hypothetical protein